MEIKPVDGADDLQTCIDIFFTTINDLHSKQGQPILAREDHEWVPATIEHFSRTDPETVVLAFDGADPVAFAAAFARESFWYLAFLFVMPGKQSAGTGTAVLEHILPDDRTMDLATGVEAAQPVSTMLYARYGIVPRVPMYEMSGLPRTDDLPRLPAGITPGELGPAQQPEVDALDRRILGYARPRDHEMWKNESKAARAYFTEEGHPRGYGYLGGDDYIGPVASTDERFTASIIRDLIRAAEIEPSKAMVPTFGSSGTLLPIMLGAGMRTESKPPLIYCSNGRVPDPAYVVYAAVLP